MYALDFNNLIQFHEPHLIIHAKIVHVPNLETHPTKSGSFNSRDGNKRSNLVFFPDTFLETLEF